MTDHRDAHGNPTYIGERSNTGLIIGGVLLTILIVAGLLFATGLWSANVKAGAVPDVAAHLKEVVAGSGKQTATAPKFETKRTSINAPMIGAKYDS